MLKQRERRAILTTAALHRRVTWTNASFLPHLSVGNAMKAPVSHTSRLCILEHISAGVEKEAKGHRFRHVSYDELKRTDTLRWKRIWLCPSQPLWFILFMKNISQELPQVTAIGSFTQRVW